MKLRYTTEEVIEKFKEIHKDKYTYEHFVYNGSHTKSTVTCPVHGDFFVTPNKHLLGRGCPECANEKRRQSLSLTDSVYIERCRLIHKGKYHYDKTHLCGGLHNKVIITCPIHGDFKQEANEHLRGHGCPKCGGTKKLTTDECIKKFKILHGEQYIYNKVEYQNSCTKVCIICPEHGEFWQTPNSHLLGCGCPKCKRSHMENDISMLLTNNNIEFIEQKKFSWLGLQSLDFYLPKYNIGIECQGMQHFEPTRHFKNCEVLLKRDELKHQLCSENNLKLLYYTDYNISDETLNKHRIYTKDNLVFNKKELLNKVIN